MKKPSTMFLSLFVLVASFSTLRLARAQFSDLPECGVKCATEAAEASGCSSSDISCACSKNTFIPDATRCIYSTCPIEDRSGSQFIIRQICADAPKPSTSSSSAVPSSSSSTTVSSSISSSSVATQPSSSPSPSQDTRTTSSSSATASTTAVPASSNNPTRAVVGSLSSASRSSSVSGTSTVVVIQTVGAGEDESGLIGSANAIGVKLTTCIVAGVLSIIGMGAVMA